MEFNFLAHTKEEILENLYISTQEFIPGNFRTLKTEFNGFLGLFYYFNAETGETFWLRETLAEELNITVGEAIEAVNKNTENDLIALPLDNNLSLQLIDINGGHIEKILLNQKRIRKILRTRNCYKLYFIPVSYFKWYITDSDIIDSVSCKGDLINIFKEDIYFDYCFEITSTGEITKINFN